MVPAQFARDTHQLLDLLDSALLRRAPRIPQHILRAAAHMQAHGDADRIDGQHIAHIAFHGHDGAIRHGTHEVGQAVDAGRIHPAANRHPVQVQRPPVEAASHQPLD
jgi:hypothetical protein